MHGAECGAWTEGERWVCGPFSFPLFVVLHGCMVLRRCVNSLSAYWSCEQAAVYVCMSEVCDVMMCSL